MTGNRCIWAEAQSRFFYFFAREIIQFFSILLCVDRNVHKFDLRFVTDSTVIETRVFDKI